MLIANNNFITHTLRKISKQLNKYMKKPTLYLKYTTYFSVSEFPHILLLINP